MKRFLRRLLIPLVRDDLFVRVACFLAGLLFGGFGIAMSVWGATHDFSPNIQVLCWVFATPFTAWGGLLVSRCVLSAQSRMVRFVDRYLPDAVGFEEAAALILAIYLPAALLTFLLRLIGVRGQRTSSMTLGKGTRVARPPGSLPRPPT
jgi:hypothetical protein